MRNFLRAVANLKKDVILFKVVVTEYRRSDSCTACQLKILPVGKSEICVILNPVPACISTRICGVYILPNGIRRIPRCFHVIPTNCG